MISPLRSALAKNWPEVRSAVCGELPQFVFATHPREPEGCTPAFCYHSLDADTFRADLAFLKRNGYTTLDADQLADHMEGIAPAPPRAVALTIDDGLKDLYTTAFPLLAEFDMCAIAFIAPGLHTRQRLPEKASRRLCTWKEIQEMHISGLVDFQSHTLEHRYIPQWPQPSPINCHHRPVPLFRSPPLPLRLDLATARAELERRLHKRIEHVAFPQYDGTPEAVRIALECGHRTMWWGLLPERRGNDVGDPLTHITRLSGDLLRRLPGDGRISLASALRRRLPLRFEWFKAASITSGASPMHSSTS